MSTSVDRLGPLDRLMLGVSARWPQDVGALLLLDGTPLATPSGEPDIDAVRAAVGARLGSVPRLRQVLRVPRRGLGGPLWVDAEDFDVADHVVLRRLPAGTDEPGLLAVTEELRRQGLDLSRPLWRMWVLPGLADGRVAVFVTLHHAIADGMVAMETISALLDADPEAPATEASPWRPTPPPSDRDLLVDTVQRGFRAVQRAASTLRHPATSVRHAREAWPAVRELLAEEPATRTSLDRMVGPDRRLAVVRTTLDDVRGVAHAHGATVNDVVLALTAGGLRSVLRSRGELVEGTTVRTYVPVSLRLRRPGARSNNAIAQMAVPLALDRSEAGERLRRIAAETATRKARARTSLGTLVGGRVARGLLLRAVMRQRVNVTTASIPGPPTPQSLCGARVLEVFPVLPLVANEPLGVGALSYAGQLTVGVVVDPDVLPDLGVFMAGACEELLALGVPPRELPTIAAARP